MSFIKQLTADISNAVRLPEAFQQQKNTNTNTGAVPWSSRGLDSIESAFFKPFEIDAQRWNKLYPYRLLVVDVVDGVVISGRNGSLGGKIQTEISTSGLNYIIDQELLTGNWEARLPITPQQLQVSDTYAINTSATMRGVVEEHNGTRFKMITMS